MQFNKLIRLRDSLSDLTPRPRFECPLCKVERGSSRRENLRESDFPSLAGEGRECLYRIRKAKCINPLLRDVKLFYG
jgi:hypothetical protein